MYMLRKICGTIIKVAVLAEYEDQPEQEVDITLDSGPMIEMCLDEEIVKTLKTMINQTALFEVTDVSPCGQHARAITFDLIN